MSYPTIPKQPHWTDQICLLFSFLLLLLWMLSGFPLGTVVENLPSSVGDARDIGVMQLWSLGLEDALEYEMAAHSSTLDWKTPWQRSLEDCSPWVCKRSDMSECVHTCTHTHTHTHAHINIIITLFNKDIHDEYMMCTRQSPSFHLKLSLIALSKNQRRKWSRASRKSRELLKIDTIILVFYRQNLSL